LQSFSIKSTISLLKINSTKKNNSTKEDQNIKKISCSILKKKSSILEFKKNRENYIKRVKQNESWQIITFLRGDLLFFISMSSIQ
jgi:hypothetical protein